MFLRIVSFVFFLSLTFFQLHSQTYSRLHSFQALPEIDTLFRAADSLRNYMDLKKSNPLYDQIIQTYKQPNIIAYGTLARAENLLRHRQTALAKEQLLKYENIKGQAASFSIDQRNLWGTYFYQIGQYDTAVAIFKLLEKQVKLNPKNPLFYGELLNTIGELNYHGLNETQKALGYFNRALKIWETQDDLLHYTLGRLYYNLGNMFAKRNEYNLLILYADKAMRIAKIYSNQYPRIEFACYALLTIIQSLNGNEKEAIDLCLQQLDFAKKNNLEESLIDFTYNNVSENYLEAKEYKIAIEFNIILINRLKKENYESKSTLNLIFPIALRRQAICLAQLGKIEEAHLFHQQSLKANAQYYGYDNRRYGQAWRYYAEFLLEQKNLKEALSAIDSSIVIYNKQWINEQDVSYLYGLMLGHQQKGLILLAFNNNEKMAFQSFLKAGNCMDSIRAHYFMDESQLDFSANAKSIYENIIITAQSLFQQTKDSSYYNAIFQAFESNKYQTLWQKITEKSLLEYNVLPDSINIINQKIENLHKAIQQKKGNESQLKLEIAKWNELKSQLLFKSNIKGYQNNGYSLKELQNHLSANDIILELFEGDSIGYGLVIQPHQSMFFQFKISAQYIHQLSELKRILAGSQLANTVEKQLLDFIKNASSIASPFNTVLQKIPLHNNVKYTLTIIPDGRFTFLPFEAFLINSKLDKASLASFQNLPYWVKNYNIQYNISAKLFLQHKEENSKRKINTIAAVGPKRSAILMSAENEIAMIDKKFGRKSAGFLNNQIRSIKSGKFYSSILHIAGHAVIDTINYNHSFIHFGNELEDSLKLFDYEISNLNINAPLVILNACETFKGKEYKGEGVYNLNQSFIIGGAESVISTLWKIEDKAASLFMNNFYSLIKKGRSISLSVNESKRVMIASEKHAHPFFWAAYLYNGETNATYMRYSYSFYLKGLIFSAILFFWVYVMIKYYKKQHN
jgi:CHAT domain-containing protein